MMRDLRGGTFFRSDARRFSTSKKCLILDDNSPCFRPERTGILVSGIDKATQVRTRWGKNTIFVTYCYHYTYSRHSLVELVHHSAVHVVHHFPLELALKVQRPCETANRAKKSARIPSCCCTCVRCHTPATDTCLNLLRHCTQTTCQRRLQSSAWTRGASM